jgi:hypothetical protein
MLDAQWRASPIYIGPGGKDTCQLRYSQIGEMIMAGNAVKMPEIGGDTFFAATAYIGLSMGPIASRGSEIMAALPYRSSSIKNTASSLSDGSPRPSASVASGTEASRASIVALRGALRGGLPP